MLISYVNTVCLCLLPRDQDVSESNEEVTGGMPREGSGHPPLIAGYFEAISTAGDKVRSESRRPGIDWR